MIRRPLFNVEKRGLIFSQRNLSVQQFYFGHWSKNGSSFIGRHTAYPYSPKTYKFNTPFDITAISEVINPNNYYDKNILGCRGFVLNDSGSQFLACANIDNNWWAGNTSETYTAPSVHNLNNLGDMQTKFSNGVWRDIMNWNMEDAGKYCIWHHGNKVCKITMREGHEDDLTDVANGSLSITDLGAINGYDANASTDATIQSVFFEEGNKLLVYNDINAKFKVYSCATPYDASSISFEYDMTIPQEAIDAGYNLRGSYSFRILNDHLFMSKYGGTSLFKFQLI